MKKALSVIIILLITFTAFAQKRTVFINEFFNDIDIPEGWNVTGGGKNNWSISESNLAGGNANELKFSWTPQHYGISRMVTNAVDLTNVNSVYLSFKHFLNNHDGENTIGVATSSDNGNTWNIAWSQSYSSTGGFVINENISTSDMGKSNVLFCIFFDGVSNTITSWHFDDFMILTQDDYNINLLSIDVNNNLNAGETDITFTIQNEGISTVESFEARYDIKGLCSVTQTFNTNMGTLDSKQFTFDTPAVIPPGTYNLSVEITSINNNEDNYPNNNIIEEELSVIMGLVDRKPLIEHFSSSTCGPCVSVNQSMLYLTKQNKDKFTYVKYTTSWPSPGDPYHTEEGSERTYFYWVSGVPQIYLDARDMGTPITQIDLNERYDAASYMDIKGSFTTNGNTIKVIADFMAYKDIPSAKAFVVVNEKTTIGNNGSNGEEEFHHVMMKMLSGTSGSEISLKAGEYKRLEYSYDMSQTFVEEMDDLEVALWVQNLNDWEVYNSNFAYEYSEHPYPAKNLRLQENEGNLDITWDAPESTTYTGFNLYVNNVLVKSNTNEMGYTYENVGNYCIVKVETLYGNRKSVSIIKTYPTSDDGNEDDGNEDDGNEDDGNEDDNVSIEENISSINIHPNPVNDKLYIETDIKIEEVVVYDIFGRLQLSAISGQQSAIDVTNLNNGIYFVKIVTDNGDIVKRFVKK